MLAVAVPFMAGIMGIHPLDGIVYDNNETMPGAVIGAIIALYLGGTFVIGLRRGDRSSEGQTHRNGREARHQPGLSTKKRPGPTGQLDPPHEPHAPPRTPGPAATRGQPSQTGTRNRRRHGTPQRMPQSAP